MVAVSDSINLDKNLTKSIIDSVKLNYEQLIKKVSLK